MKIRRRHDVALQAGKAASSRSNVLPALPACRATSVQLRAAP